MCHFPIGILGQVWYLIVSIIDLCTLTYFQNLNFNIFLGFQKNKYFWGMKIFWGSSQNRTIFRVDFYAFKGLFLRSSYRMGIFFGVCKISNIFLGCLKFLIFFGSESTYAKKK